jgi:hypothetical protein
MDKTGKINCSHQVVSLFLSNPKCQCIVHGYDTASRVFRPLS